MSASERRSQRCWDDVLGPEYRVVPGKTASARQTPGLVYDVIARKPWSVPYYYSDAQEKTDGAKSVPEAAYRALIHLDNDYLDSQGKRLRLVPGMLVNAEIHLGTRTVLEYLLSPIQKATHEAGRER